MRDKEKISAYSFDATDHTSHRDSKDKDCTSQLQKDDKHSLHEVAFQLVGSILRGDDLFGILPHPK